MEICYWKVEKISSIKNRYKDVLESEYTVDLEEQIDYILRLSHGKVHEKELLNNRVHIVCGIDRNLSVFSNIFET